MPYVPVVVINKQIEERIIPTIRHIRARGEHNVTLVSGIVTELVRLGRSDEEVSKHFGMSANEVLRLKQNKGIAEISKEQEFSSAWE